MTEYFDGAELLKLRKTHPSPSASGAMRKRCALSCRSRGAKASTSSGASERLPHTDLFEWRLGLSTQNSAAGGCCALDCAHFCATPTGVVGSFPWFSLPLEKVKKVLFFRGFLAF